MKPKWSLALALVVIAGCNSEKSTGPNNQTTVAQVNQYFDSLPTWSQFSPLLPTDSPAPTGAAPTLSYDTVGTVTQIDSLGNESTYTNVPYVCEATPYSVQETPEQIVMYSPDAAILYPGAFIQGKTYKAGIGSLLPLNFARRAPINVSIPAIQTGANYRTVDTVDQAHVASAVGSIIGSAVANNLQASSSIKWHMDTYYSDNQFALTFNASGHYLGFSASVGGSIQTDASQHTVVAEFAEKMFTVVVSPPPTPAGWFNSNFTAADLQQQVSLGNIGPTNLPVYISNIVYGRMMMFAVTSTASVSDIRASISASYSGLGGGVSSNLTSEQKKILQTATIQIASVGGNDSATIAMIRTGDWSQYFTSSAPLSTAEPLSYEFRNLADNTVAQVSEATAYNVTACSPASAGQFSFLPAQSFAPPVPVPFETRLVDVNGNGRPDLVFNHRDASGGQVAVALAGTDGSFGTPGAAAPGGGTSHYTLATGDFTGNGRTDLLWSYLGGDTLAVDVALADGTGGWTFLPEQTFTGTPPASGFANYNVYVGDIDGDGAADLIFNQVSTDNNYVLAALSNKDGTFAFDSTVQLLGTGGWAPYIAAVADYNGDGKADLVFNTINGSFNQTEVATSNGDGTFTNLGPTNRTDGLWYYYQRLVADFTGDQKPDWLFYRDPSGNPDSRVYIVSGMQTMLPYTPLANVLPRQYYTAMAGDVNGDGIADLLLNYDSSTTNTIAAVLGTTSGTLSTGTALLQIHPVSTNWSTALPTMVGDVNGDGDADVVWVISGSPTRVFVGLSRGPSVGLARARGQRH